MSDPIERIREALNRPRTASTPLGPVVVIDPIVRREDLAELLAERDALKAAIEAHNIECITRCEIMRQQPNHGQGGICAHYTNRGRTCPNCPRDEMIEIDATRRKE